MEVSAAPPPIDEAAAVAYRRLTRIAHALLLETDLEQLLGTIAASIGELVPYDELVIFASERGKEELVAVFADSPWRERIIGMSCALGFGITGKAAAERRSLLVNDAHQDPRCAQVPGTPESAESLISIPLVARADKGVLNIHRIGPAHARFSQVELEVAECFAELAALALENAQMRQSLERLARVDDLTGIVNRRGFDERLAAAIAFAHRNAQPLSLVLVDLDQFKQVNDLHGHCAGDDVLAAIAKKLSEATRKSDLVARLGGNRSGQPRRPTGRHPDLETQALPLVRGR